VNDECRSGLRRKYFTDLYRDDTVTMHHGLELRVPYLDHDLIEHAMTLPHDVKDVTSKQVIRGAAQRLGLPKTVAQQPKSATQYGSGTANELKRLAADNDDHVGDYIQRRCSPPNTRVATLLSTGKDSCLATQRMIDYNYDITSFLTVKPEQKNSYMSHAANIDVARKQASAANKALLVETSEAEKENELDDYQRLIQRAKHEQGVEGVVTGAVASEYQRQRIERICDRVGVKPYAPLWHTPGESVIKQILKRGFDVIYEKTAAAGFDESWIEKHIEPHVLEELRGLKDEYGVHVAGEGGEFETLVLDAPFFTQRLVIDDSEVVSDGRVHRLRINDLSLRSKDE
jgi:asparagine synthase (glutamine-hydrolysing)